MTEQDTVGTTVPTTSRRLDPAVVRIALAVVAGGIAVAVSEDLRNKVLDALFGKEEEFDYTSTTTPASAPPPATPAAAS